MLRIIPKNLVCLYGDIRLPLGHTNGQYHAFSLDNLGLGDFGDFPKGE